MNPDWVDCEIAIYADNFQKETELSYSFLLWGRKRQVIPKKFAKNYYFDDRKYTMMLPKWFIEKNGLASLMTDKEQKELLFPPKRPKKVKAAGLFDEPQVEAETTIAVPAQPVKPDWF